MARKDYKDTIVLDPIVDDEIDEVIVENERVAEEREKAEAMSKDELIAYLLQTKENLWSSHDERDLLEGKIKERDQKLEEKIKEKDQELEEKNEKIRNLEIEVSDSKKEIINLKEQNAKKDSKIDSLTSQAKESSNLKEQISVLQQQLHDKEDAVNVMEDNLKDSKAEVERLTTELKKSEEEITKLNERTAEAESVNLEGISVKEMIERLNSSVDEVNADFAAQRKKLDKKHREKIIEICEQVVTDSQKEIITKQELREAKIKAKKKLESKRAQKEDLDAEIAELEDYVEANEA